jgi:hypothetical protein
MKTCDAGGRAMAGPESCSVARAAQKLDARTVQSAHGQASWRSSFTVSSNHYFSRGELIVAAPHLVERYLIHTMRSRKSAIDV